MSPPKNPTLKSPALRGSSQGEGWFRHDTDPAALLPLPEGWQRDTFF